MLEFAIKFLLGLLIISCASSEFQESHPDIRRIPTDGRVEVQFDQKVRKFVKLLATAH